MAAVTFAEDPDLCAEPALAHTKLSVSTHWAGYFIAALAGDPCSGHYRRRPRRTMPEASAPDMPRLGCGPQRFRHRLHVGESHRDQPAGLFRGWCRSPVHGNRRSDGTPGASEEQRPWSASASVAALWAIAWAGTKPFASLLDGCAGHSSRPHTHSAFVLVLARIGHCLRRNRSSHHRGKARINAWAGSVISDRRSGCCPLTPA